MSGYYKAYTAGDEEKKSACMRWLRGEYSTKTEARNATGIQLGGIIDDDTGTNTSSCWRYSSAR